MSYHRLIPLYQLDLADLLQVDANYAGLSDAELYNLTPGTYDPDFLRKTLARGEYLYCTDTPALQLVFFDQGNYYINPAAEISAGEDVVQALKKRFSALKHDKPAPYQIIGSMTSSGIRTSYYPPRTGPVAPVNYTPDPTPANTTPIEKTVKDWLTIRFYRFSADREREYLANVPTVSTININLPIKISSNKATVLPMAHFIMTICLMMIFIPCTTGCRVVINTPQKSWCVCEE